MVITDKSNCCYDKIYFEDILKLINEVKKVYINFFMIRKIFFLLNSKG